MRIKQYTTLYILIATLFLGFAILTSCGKEEINEPPIEEGENPDPEPENPDPGSGTIAVTSITLNYKDLTLVRKTSEEVKATVLPENASDKKVTWTSSNIAIAEVDTLGKIKAIAPGTATITAKAGDKTAQCKIMVPNHDIYMTGYQQFESGSNAKNTARLWKNGDLVNITQPPSKDAIAFGFYMSGNNIYLVGNEKRPNTNDAYATLWTNGAPVRLSDGSSYSIAYDVVRVNNDVFAVGYDKGMACYWKNGKKTDLYTATAGSANTISYASVGNLYIGGSVYSGGQERGAIWKNANLSLLGTAGVMSRVSKIVTVGHDVYAMGYLRPNTVIWKNQNLISTSFIGANGFIDDMDISGSDVYVLGRLALGGESFVWKNGVKLNMSFPKSASLSKIQIVDGVIYVGGFSNVDKIAIFANGRLMDIAPQSGAKQTQTISMKVIKR